MRRRRISGAGFVVVILCFQDGWTIRRKGFDKCQI